VNWDQDQRIRPWGSGSGASNATEKREENSSAKIRVTH